MTRTAKGRGPGRTVRPNVAAQETVGKRITVPPPATKHRRGKRARVLQVAALLFVVALIAVSLVGCAKYNGNQAEFCTQLKQAPSFAALSVQTNSGTDAQAASAMHRASRQFRDLEKTAPRSIRVQVSALGDSAERIANALQSDHQVRGDSPVMPAIGPPINASIPGMQSQGRIAIFYNEVISHQGTISAMTSLATYATKHCGVAQGGVDLGILGYGSPQSDQGFGPFGGSQTTMRSDAPTTSVIPPATVVETSTTTAR